MSILFISDLHLERERPTITQLFIEFLQKQAHDAEALYILGDFFEVWVGDDDHNDLNQQICAALKTATKKGLPIYIMHGNRDFLLGQKFMHQTGCRLLTDPTLINLYGQPTLLMHGDTLCTEDESYLNFRKKVRNTFNQQIYLKLPLGIRKWIARVLRSLSHRRGNQYNYNFFDANLDEIKRLMIENKAELLIHGHTHWPSIQHFKLQEKNAARIVLSDWETSGNVLICQPNGQKRLMNF